MPQDSALPPVRRSPAGVPVGLTPSLERWATVPFALVGGLLGALAVARLVEFGPPFSHMSPINDAQLFGAGAITAALTYAAHRIALRPRSPLGVVGATFFASVTFAVINTSVSCFVVLALDGGGAPLQLYFLALVAGLVGMPASIPLGFLWALAFAAPLHLIATLRDEPTLDGRDRVLRAVGTTVAVVCTLGALQAQSFDVLPRLLGLGALGGLVAAAVAVVRLHLFQRFLRRVRLGVEDGWVIAAEVDFDEAAGPSSRAGLPDGLPRTHVTSYVDGLLVRVVSAGAAGAYRTGGESATPWAWTTH